MGIAAIKAKIVELLQALPDAGQVVDFPGGLMEAEATGQFSGFYTEVVRNGVAQSRRTMGGSGAGRMDRGHTVNIDVWLPMDVHNGAAQSALEAKFDTRIDAVLQLLADNPGLDGIVGRSEPPQALDDPVGIRLWRGALQCRWRRIRWDVQENTSYDGRR